MREGGFTLEVLVNGRAILEREVNGRPVILATAGAAFEVVLRNENRGDYLVRLSVDGVEVDPGFLKRVRGRDSATFRGFVCHHSVHEFLFAKTPIDEHARGSAAEQKCIGEVSAAIFATRHVRLEESSSDHDDDPARRSSAHISARALPEKAAVKEFGVQARAGGAIEQIPRYRRRRRGDYRLEKVTPEVATMQLLYRDSFWFARNVDVPLSSQVAACSSTPAACASAPAASARTASEPAAPMAPAPTAARASSLSIAMHEEPVKHELAPKIDAGQASDLWYSQKAAKPLARRAPGETARGPDGKRRKLARPGGEQPEVVVLSD